MMHWWCTDMMHWWATDEPLMSQKMFPSFVLFFELKTWRSNWKHKCLYYLFFLSYINFDFSITQTCFYTVRYILWYIPYIYDNQATRRCHWHTRDHTNHPGSLALRFFIWPSTICPWGPEVATQERIQNLANQAYLYKWVHVTSNPTAIKMVDCAGQFPQIPISRSLTILAYMTEKAWRPSFRPFLKMPCYIT